MTFAYWCVLIAMFFPMIWAALAKTGPGFDNQSPRAYLASLSGWRQRANWAQENALEAFPPFAAAVIIAHNLEIAQSTLNALALTWLILRALHGIFYIMDQATLRSLSWVLAMACVVAFFVLGAFPG